jgi:four helix bundle protein
VKLEGFCGLGSLRSIWSALYHPFSSAAALARVLVLAPAVRSDLKERTKRFALDILRLSAELRPESPGWLLRGQLARAGTGVGANYRVACRGKSRSDFITKLTTAEEEADETAYWLELLVGAHALPVERARPLLQEAGELTAILVSSIKTAKKNRS